MMKEKTAARISRSMYIIPGGYFIAKALRSAFGSFFKQPEWRTFSFREIKMKVDLSKQMGAAIYWRGSHDWAPIFALEKLLTKGDVFIDIGANQGEYSLWAAKQVHETGKVIAFEPMGDLFDQLCDNIDLNPNFIELINPIKMGLSDVPGKLQLYTKKGINEGVNTLYPNEEYNIPLGEIKLDTLDHQVKLLGLERIDCIKIDVEGAELQVLKGAQETINRFMPKLMVEINKSACITGGYKAEDILDLLKSMGYRFSVIGLRGKLKPLGKKLPEFCNIVAFSQSSD